MPISDADTKLLWGRAAGICSNPDCREDLTIILDQGQGYNIGEMAHVIARGRKNPGGRPSGGNDTYDNLILLCPSCHRRIDKAPAGQYPKEKLHDWKAQHEKETRRRGTDELVESGTLLKERIALLLRENQSVWSQLGPTSPTATADPGSNLHMIWSLRKLDAIVPNNRRIMNLEARTTKPLPVA